MVIGSLSRHSGGTRGCFVALASIFLALRLIADDQIVKTDGSVITGHIASVSGDQVWVEGHTSSGGIARVPYYITDIKPGGITMAIPPDVTKVQAPNTPPASIIAALEPQVKLYAGLPVPWVVDAMALLGDAYTQVGQTDKALAIYTKIGELYPGSAYVHVADASKAQVDLDAGKIDDAMKLLQPIVEQADKNLAPSPTDAATYAKAFLVYGKVLLAQKKPQLALEKFLTVKTMFYQNPALVAEAEHYVEDVRKNNPGIGVE
jgi:tetratricopeptide (TPR) repeat protein